jgi:hypothetical protein
MVARDPPGRGDMDKVTDMSGLGVLGMMVAHYAYESSRLDNYSATETMRLKVAGMADMIVHVAGVLYGEDTDTATERVADMIDDVRTAMAD